MEHFVTLFDSLFLPQGLALHRSMERHIKHYTLWIICVDDEAFEVLGRLRLPNVKLLQLSRLETPELLEIKASRSKGEYCWTLTPFSPRFVFEADADVGRVIGVDADLWFRKPPRRFSVIRCFREAGSYYRPCLCSGIHQSATSGQFCVQFMTFTRNGGDAVRKWRVVRRMVLCPF